MQTVLKNRWFKLGAQATVLTALILGLVTFVGGGKWMGGGAVATASSGTQVLTYLVVVSRTAKQATAPTTTRMVPSVKA